MHDSYDYVTASTYADPAGGIAVGAWSGVGSIGWHDDERITLVGWPAGSPPAARVAPPPGGTVVRLRATARPSEVRPLAAGGVFAHRWFDLAASDWDEFLALSTEAWPTFERAYGATIEAFLRAEDVPPGSARVLLVTRYPSLAAWQESRGAIRDPSGEVAQAGRNFLRRRELTRRSIVRVAWLGATR